MNAASLELCRELYELSGWSGCQATWIQADDLETKEPFVSLIRNLFRTEDEKAPAYDLGFMIRKLPAAIDKCWLSIAPLTMESSQWSASYEKDEYGLAPLYDEWGDTPEDALAKLCIELFKQGVLTKEINR